MNMLGCVVYSHVSAWILLSGLNEPPMPPPSYDEKTVPNLLIQVPVIGRRVQPLP